MANAIETVRHATDFLFLASLFPQDGAQFQPDVEAVMSPEEVASGATYLQMIFDTQKDVYTKQRNSVDAALKAIGVAAIKSTPVGSADLTFLDDQQSWSTTVSPTSIIIGARMLRGLVLGSLVDAQKGHAAFSASLDSLLGVSLAIDIPLSELEGRTRLFFNAAVKGKPLMRFDEDFQKYNQMVLMLMNGYLSGDKSEESRFGDFQRRLLIASRGGPINGADGMAMFDIFLRLQSHFDPSLNFVLSHEMGHVHLGHAPFAATLTCAERQAREDAADAFAVALLVYDLPGETEATRLALPALKDGSGTDDEDDALAFGYANAILYGFAEAGLTNQINASCSYRPKLERVQHLDVLRAKLIDKRAAAIRSFFQYFRQHPPYVHTSEDVGEMDREARDALATRLYDGCHSPRPTTPPKLKQVRDAFFGWVVECPNGLAPEFQTKAFKDAIGWQTYDDVATEYRAHTIGSSLITEDVLQELQRHQL